MKRIRSFALLALPASLHVVGALGQGGREFGRQYDPVVDLVEAKPI